MNEETRIAVDGGAWGRFTRRRFMATVSLGGAALAFPFRAQLAAQVASRAPGTDVWVAFSMDRRERPVEQLEHFVLDTARGHLPPLVVALSHGGGRGFAKLVALRSRAAAGRGRGLLIHRFLDLGRVASVRGAMGADAAIEEIDGWHLKLPGVVTADSLRRFEAAIEIASRMARHVLWLETGTWAAWLPALGEAALANPWLSFVVVGAAEILGSHTPALAESMQGVLRRPNVLVHLESRQMLGSAGRMVLDWVGYGGIVWGIQDLTATAVALDPLRLRMGLGRRAGDSVLASRAVAAYGLQAHHYA